MDEKNSERAAPKGAAAKKTRKALLAARGWLSRKSKPAGARTSLNAADRADAALRARAQPPSSPLKSDTPNEQGAQGEGFPSARQAPSSWFSRARPGPRSEEEWAFAIGCEPLGEKTGAAGKQRARWIAAIALFVAAPLTTGLAERHMIWSAAFEGDPAFWSSYPTLLGVMPVSDLTPWLAQAKDPQPLAVACANGSELSQERAAARESLAAAQMERKMRQPSTPRAARGQSSELRGQGELGAQMEPETEALGGSALGAPALSSTSATPLFDEREKALQAQTARFAPCEAPALLPLTAWSAGAKYPEGFAGAAPYAVLDARQWPSFRWAMSDADEMASWSAGLASAENPPAGRGGFVSGPSAGPALSLPQAQAAAVAARGVARIAPAKAGGWLDVWSAGVFHLAVAAALGGLIWPGVSKVLGWTLGRALNRRLLSRFARLKLRAISARERQAWREMETAMARMTGGRFNPAKAFDGPARREARGEQSDSGRGGDEDRGPQEPKK